MDSNNDDTHNLCRTAQEAKTRDKTRILTRSLKPVPFRPIQKPLDFATHETLLRRIGLWEFAHVEFDHHNIRVDLVAQLIASYAPSLRCGYVNGFRVLANQAQLARALRLPIKKKGEALEEGGVLEGLDFAESIDFVERFVRNWMVLHDDACHEMKMPAEVLEGTRLIREGCLEKVDWGGLVWSMVEREMRDPGLCKCYYASHLQLLIRAQREELLREVPVVVVEDEDEDEEEEVVAVEKKDACGDVGMGGVVDFEEPNIQLILGNGDFGIFGGETTPGFYPMYDEGPFLGLNTSVGEPFLRQCDVNVNGLDRAESKDEEGEEGQESDDYDDGMEGDDEEDDDGTEGEDDDDDDATGEEDKHKDHHHAMQAVEVEMPFRTLIDRNDNSVGCFNPSRDDFQMISGPSFFSNGRTHNRDMAGHDYHNTNDDSWNGNGSNKRLRLDDNPRNAEPVDFDICMGQLEHWIDQARLMHATKVQSLVESTKNEQLLRSEIQNRDNMIEQLRKELLDESQKGQMNVNRLEKELYMMTKLLKGYREAIRETGKAFDEYRARCLQAEESLYKDVAGSKGLVLSVEELEKEQVKQGEEEERMKRLAFEEHLRDFEGRWMGKFEGQLSRIQSLDNRLMSVEDQVKLLHERNVKTPSSFQT